MNLVGVSEKFDSLDCNRVAHSIRVAEVSMELAGKLGLSKNFAYLCGLYHDIGYSESNDHHQSKGYEILQRLGLKSISYVALFHSMAYDLDSNIPIIRREIDLVDAPIPYIDVVSSADFMVSSTGEKIGIEARLEDIGNRYGLDSNQYLIGELQRVHTYNWFRTNNLEYDFK